MVLIVTGIDRKGEMKYEMKLAAMKLVMKYE